MPFAVASFVSDVDVGANPATVTASWSTGNTIVVAGFIGEDTETVGPPTATGLTFTARSTQDSNLGTEAACVIWTATAGSNGTSVTVSLSSTGAQIPILGVWVISGTVGAFVPLPGTLVDAAYNATVVAGSLVFVAFALTGGVPARTATTGSGTATERIDTGVVGDIGAWAAEWLGTAAGTFSFGVTNYTGIAVAQVGLILEPPPPSLTQEGYRFGLDDGTEAGHGWLAAQDTPVTETTGVTRLLRALVEETGGESDITSAYRLQYKRTDENDSEWRDV